MKAGKIQAVCWYARFCVPLSYVLDEYDDCGDGSDEGTIGGCGRNGSFPLVTDIVWRQK